MHMPADERTDTDTLRRTGVQPVPTHLQRGQAHKRRPWAQPCKHAHGEQLDDQAVWSGERIQTLCLG